LLRGLFPVPGSRASIAREVAGAVRALDVSAGSRQAEKCAPILHRTGLAFALDPGASTPGCAHPSVCLVPSAKGGNRTLSLPQPPSRVLPTRLLFAAP
jgi:hypothetical protein